MFDAKDVEILDILQKDARIANAEIARKLEMAPSAILERIRKLEARGAIRAYEARLSPRAVGLGLLAFVFARGDDRKGSEDVARRLASFPEVLEVHQVAGEDCFLLKVRASDTDDLARILRERLGSVSELRSTRTTIVLQTHKESAALALDQLAPEARKETANAQ
jgi:Lrp/AsnC family transcriptional regulator, leucine-responsive regulatory protein